MKVQATDTAVCSMLQEAVVDGLDLADVALQVAHDIRSPLMAIKAVVASLKDMPDAHRNLLEGACDRLNSIAEELLQKRKEVEKYQQTNKSHQLEANNDVCNVTEGKALGSEQNIFAIRSIQESICQVIGEKRFLNPTVNIEFAESLEYSSGGLALSPFKLSAIVSNLLNNSVEAEAGNIMVSLEVSKGCFKLTVEDDGRGFPGILMGRFGTKGFSFGKDRGNGLGLYGAKQEIKKMGGSFKLNSPKRRGAKVSLSLPL